LNFQGKIFLIDVGPNITHTLNAIGVDANEVEGIFHTHAHDDHFAGLASLIRTNHRIKYYTTTLVRASVTKKLCSLLSIKENTFKDYFEICDLEFDKWNNIGGLEVRPLFSPHPVETNILFFRTLWEEGYVTYAHLADVASHDVLKKMAEEDKKMPGISKKLMKKIWDDFLNPAQVKKIDIGGGIIHGKANDFKTDKSEKIILAHTAHKLTEDEKLIGCGVTFGSTDVLIEGHEDYALEFGANYLRGFFPKVEESEIHLLLNCERESVIVGTVLLRDQEIPEHVCLVLTGVAELISTKEKTNLQLSCGSLIGDLEVLFELRSKGTYRALSYIEILKIPAILFKEFVNRNQLMKQIQKTQEIIKFVEQTWLLGDSISAPIQNRIAQSITVKKYKKGQKIKCTGLMLVKKGKVELTGLVNGKQERCLVVEEGDYWGVEKIISNRNLSVNARAYSPTTVYSIADIEILRQIPIVRWKMLEQSEKRE